MSGETTPHPCEQTGLLLADGTTCTYESCNETEMVIYVAEMFFDDEKDVFEQFNRGNSRPYLGSGTSEKRPGAIISYPKTEKALRAAQQLLRVKNWVIDQDDPSNTLPDLLIGLIQSRCDASEEYLLLTSGVNYGGSVQHRFSDVTSKHESRPGIRVNLHSRVSICSDNLGKYARGLDNYPIVFQSNYLYALCSINHHILLNRDLLTKKNQTYHQSDVFPILNETPMTCDEIPPRIQIMKNCPLVFSSLEKDLCEMPINCLANVPRVEPNSEDKNLLRLSAHAAALVIVGEMSNLSTPVLQSGLRYQHREGNLICLTVGFFLKTDLRILFERIMVIWVLDKLEEILHIVDGYHMELDEAVEILLERVPDKSWELLKPYLCLTEVQQELILKLDCKTTSSEAFVRRKGLGYLVNSLILSQFKKVWSLGKQNSLA